MKNKLYFGLKKKIDWPKGSFLCIDDEANHPKAKVFDPLKHSFNPLKDITYKKAREIANVLYTISPEGENTLITVRNGKRAMLKMLMRTKRLDELVLVEDSGIDEVWAMIDDLLESPVLKRVLCSDGNEFQFGGSNKKVVARINRAELGEFDALVLGLFLMAHYKGQLVVPDLGFYGREAHVALVREGRLIAGVNHLAELPTKL